MVETKAVVVVAAAAVLVVVAVVTVVAVVFSGSMGIIPVVLELVKVVVAFTMFGAGPAVVNAWVDVFSAVGNEDVVGEVAVEVEVAVAEAAEVEVAVEEVAEVAVAAEVVIKVAPVAFSGVIACATVALEGTPVIFFSVLFV